MVHECVPIGASIRASRASWDYSRASAQLCRSQQQHGLGRERERERACTSRILSTRRFHDISLQRPYRLSCMLSRKFISDRHAYRCLNYTCMHIGIDKLTPQYDARVHTAWHMFFAGAIKLANSSPNTCRSSGPLAFKSRLQIQPSLSIAISSR